MNNIQKKLILMVMANP